MLAVGAIANVVSSRDHSVGMCVHDAEINGERKSTIWQARKPCAALRVDVTTSTDMTGIPPLCSHKFIRPQSQMAHYG
jgi:hypothetical protein